MFSISSFFLVLIIDRRLFAALAALVDRCFAS